MSCCYHLFIILFLCYTKLFILYLFQINFKFMKKETALRDSEEINNIALMSGKIINLTSEIECNINLIISCHFFRDDTIFELNEFVISELSLRSKCDIMIRLLSKRYPKIYSKHKTKLSLEKVRTNRNKFAHKTLSFFVNKQGKTDYTKVQFNDFRDFKMSKDVVKISELEVLFKLSLEQLKITNDIYQEISNLGTTK